MHVGSVSSIDNRHWCHLTGILCSSLYVVAHGNDVGIVAHHAGGVGNDPVRFHRCRAGEVRAERRMAVRHFIEPGSFSLEEQLALLDLADRMEADPAPYAHLCDGRILATLFYEPSTRTRLSFQGSGQGVDRAPEFEVAAETDGQMVQPPLALANGHQVDHGLAGVGVSAISLDVLYMTRIQKERFFNEEDYLRLKDSYILTPEKLKTAKSDLCILHPLPRVNEISVAVDDDPRACYFKQVQNGKYIRMALILKLLHIN